MNDNVNDRAIDVLVSGISKYMTDAVANLPYTSMFKSTVWSRNDDGTYVITKEKNKYNVKNGFGGHIQIGKPVWICIPNGSLKDMFICGSCDSSANEDAEIKKYIDEQIKKIVLQNEIKISSNKAYEPLKQ